jgi:hypothetical protein
MSRASKSAPPLLSAFKSLAANYKLRCGNDEFKIAGFLVIIAIWA